MDLGLLPIFLFAFLVYAIDTLAPSVRLIGTRTRRLAVSLSLFNLLLLVSRTANAFQGPLLAKRIEAALVQDAVHQVESDIRWLLFAATLATAAAALLIPSFHRFFSQAVEAFERHRSVPRLVMQGFSPAGISQLRVSLRKPSWSHAFSFDPASRLPWRIFVLHAIASSIHVLGVLAALYAGCLIPELRVTASQMSAVLNGFGTVLLFLFVDPYLSVLTDEAADHEDRELLLRRSIPWLLGGRLVGTLFAQVLLVPAAHGIALLARWI